MALQVVPPPDLSSTVRILMGATQRDEVIGAFFEFVAHYFSFAALLTVQGSLARVWAARSDRVPQERLAGLVVSVSPPSPIADVLSDGEPHWLSLESTSLQSALTGLLARPLVGLAIAIPILVRGRSVLLLYGDGDGHPFNVEQINDVLSLLPFVSSALERLILKRKLAESFPQHSVPPPSGLAHSDPSLPEEPVTADAPAVPATPLSGYFLPVPPRPPDVEASNEWLPATASVAPATTPEPVSALERECLALLERVIHGDDFAQSVLVEMGGVAARFLAARLPGPLRGSPNEGNVDSLPPSQLGPIFSILAQIGWTALPALIQESCAADPERRRWATLLLGELPWPEGATAVAERFTDPNPEVRQAALTAGQRLWNDRSVRDTLRQVLLERSTESHRSPFDRLGALNALADLRDDRAVPHLIAFLDAEERWLSKEAHRLLIRLTAQDYGPERVPYTNWWITHKASPRVEWLIDGLTHEAPQIRENVAQELKALVRELHGYEPDAPPRERMLAQQRFREWWQSRGRTG